MPSSEPHDLPTAHVELSFDEAEELGFDGTGRDGDPRFPYTVADLTPAQRQRLADLRATPAGPTTAQTPTGDDEPSLRVLSPRDATTLAAGLAEYATSDGVLDAPQLQVLYRYTPANGPACFDLDLIHESVWRRWPGADALPERVDAHTFLGLLHHLPDTTAWAQPEPHFTVVGVSLRYDAPPEPGPAPSADYAVRDEPARVTVAVDADDRYYHHVHQAGAAAGQVAVWKSITFCPLDTPNRVTHGDSSALNELSRLMRRLRTPTDPPADTEEQHEYPDPLELGDIVTVTGNQFDDDERARLWVVVDYFSDYAIAVLGGDNYQWRNIPRGDLVRVEPPWIQRTIRQDATFAYVGADTTAPVLVEETFYRSTSGGYELNRVYRLAGQVLRVRVRREVTPDASLAQAHLLNPTGGYTVVADAPAHGWYPATPADTSDAAPLVPVADGLMQRTARILTPPETTGT